MQAAEKDVIMSAMSTKPGGRPYAGRWWKGRRVSARKYVGWEEGGWVRCQRMRLRN